MDNFKTTKGNWRVKHSESKNAFNVVGTVLGGNYKIARCPYLSEDSLSKEWNEREKKEAEANAKLIADAGTTTNKCNRLPSQLLQEHEEMKAILEDVVYKFKGDNLHGYQEDLVEELEQLLTKINQ